MAVNVSPFNNKSMKFHGPKQSLFTRLQFPIVRKSVSYKVKFDESCKYVREDESKQWIVSRLFGLGKRSFRKSSTLLVWHYHPHRDTFLVDMLLYQEGQEPHIQEVAELNADQWVTLSIDQHRLYVNGNEFLIRELNMAGCGRVFIPPELCTGEIDESLTIHVKRADMPEPVIVEGGSEDSEASDEDEKTEALA